MPLTTPIVEEAPTGAAVVRSRGVVAVHRYRWGRSVAACSCGWSAGHRVLRAAAEQDAWTHAAARRCSPGVPLVVLMPPQLRSGQDLCQ